MNVKKLLVGVCLVAVAACQSSTAPVKHPQINQPSLLGSPGDPCTDSHGRSGFLVSVGNKLVCQV